MESLPSDGLQPRQFLSVQGTYKAGGEAALQEISRSKPNLSKRIGEEIESAVIELAIQEPAWGANAGVQ